MITNPTSASQEAMTAKFQTVPPVERDGSGSDVVVTPIVTSGTKIAEISVDGDVSELYTPSGSGGDENTEIIGISSFYVTGAQFFDESDLLRNVNLISEEYDDETDKTNYVISFDFRGYDSTPDISPSDMKLLFGAASKMDHIYIPSVTIKKSGEVYTDLTVGYSDIFTNTPKFVDGVFGQGAIYFEYNDPSLHTDWETYQAEIEFNGHTSYLGPAYVQFNDGGSIATQAQNEASSLKYIGNYGFPKIMYLIDGVTPVYVDADSNYGQHIPGNDILISSSTGGGTVSQYIISNNSGSVLDLSTIQFILRGTDDGTHTTVTCECSDSTVTITGAPSSTNVVPYTHMNGETGTTYLVEFELTGNLPSGETVNIILTTTDNNPGWYGYNDQYALHYQFTPVATPT